MRSHQDQPLLHDQPLLLGVSNDENLFILHDEKDEIKDENVRG
jgi:hypothetical protein